MESIMARQVNLEAKLKNITKALPNLQILHDDSVKLADMISHTSTLAESVSAKVRQLDVSRVCFHKDRVLCTVKLILSS